MTKLQLFRWMDFELHNFFLGLIFLLVVGYFLATTPCQAASLEIRNQSTSEILNILVEPVDNKAGEIFLRLDLAPGAADKIENPSCNAKLRVDTGLQFWLYNAVPLKDALQLLFCPEYPGCLALRDTKGLITYQAMGIKDLVPQKGSKPVCELSSFHPLMPMKEVCALLEPDIARDDNGACLTGLGFAGKLWAARLAPFQTGPITEDSLLEHMELRTALSMQDISDVLNVLYKQDYVPWQAEFPGQDIDFADMTAMNEQDSRDLLTQAIEKFLQTQKNKKVAPQINNTADEEAEANILLAPAKSLQALANADNPPEDVQLFTMVLKPLSSTLLLDVSAYTGEQ